MVIYNYVAVVQLECHYLLTRLKLKGYADGGSKEILDLIAWSSLDAAADGLMSISP